MLQQKMTPRNVAIFAVVFGFIGFLLLWSASAAGVAERIETESGQLSANTNVCDDDENASGGEYILFGGTCLIATQPTPSPTAEPSPTATPTPAPTENALTTPSASDPEMAIWLELDEARQKNYVVFANSVMQFTVEPFTMPANRPAGDNYALRNLVNKKKDNVNINTTGTIITGGGIPSLDKYDTQWGLCGSLDNCSYQNLTDVQLTQDEDGAKKLKMLWDNGKYEKDYTIYANSPVIKVDYIKYEGEGFDDRNTRQAEDPRFPGSTEKVIPEPTDLTVYGIPESSFRISQSILDQQDAGSFRRVHNHQGNPPASAVYNGNYIFGATQKSSGLGLARVMPGSVVTEIWNYYNLSLSPIMNGLYYKTQPFTSYMYMVDGGPDQVLNLGKAIADGEIPEYGEY